MAHRVSALRAVAEAAIAACRGDRFVEEALAAWPAGGPAPSVVGVGKAVAAMAEGARRALGGRARFGPLIGKHDDPRFPIRVAGHPLPDARGAAATDELLAFLAALSDGDDAILLLSGGASSLLAAPLPGLSLDGLRAATSRLLRGGAPIAEINCVRRHLGRALGGRTAAATPARLTVLALSDVIGDDPATIGSGPASPDGTTFADAVAVAERVGIDGEARRFLAEGTRGAHEETLKPGDPRLARATVRVLAGPATLRARAAEAAANGGYFPLVEDHFSDGDVAALAARYAAAADQLAPGTVRVWVGEPTVTVAGDGLGGRSQQLALLMARALAGRDLAFAAVGSDGTDGPTDAAGAVVDGATWARAIAAGLDPAAALTRFDAHPLLDAVGALVRLPPTGTNLLDLHLLAR